MFSTYTLAIPGRSREETPEGHVIRYAPGTQWIIGLTVLGLRRILDSDGNLLVTIPEPIEASADDLRSRSRDGLSGSPAHEPNPRHSPDASPRYGACLSQINPGAPIGCFRGIAPQWPSFTRGLTSPRGQC